MALERSLAEEHLTLANQHIAEAQERIARQAALIERLAADGHDTTSAEGLLRELTAVLKTMHEHRQQIVDELSGETP